MMTKKNYIRASELDKIFDEGKEDILHYFDLSSMRRINQKDKCLDVDASQTPDCRE